MAIKSGFFNSVAGDREYFNEDFARLINTVIADGVFSTYGNLFAISPVGAHVRMDTGFCWFNNAWVENTAHTSITMPAAPIGQDRWDAVVVEMNCNKDVRDGDIKVISGVEAPIGTAVKPTMIHDELVNQYAFAYIFRGSESTKIAAEDIEIATGTIETPLASGILTQVDISVLLQGWNEDFFKWFNNLKDELTENQAANLQRQIDEVNEKLASWRGVAEYQTVVDGFVYYHMPQEGYSLTEGAEASVKFLEVPLPLVLSGVMLSIGETGYIQIDATEPVLRRLSKTAITLRYTNGVYRVVNDLIKTFNIGLQKVVVFEETPSTPYTDDYQMSFEVSGDTLFLTTSGDTATVQSMSTRKTYNKRFTSTNGTVVFANEICTYGILAMVDNRVYAIPLNTFSSEQTETDIEPFYRGARPWTPRFGGFDSAYNNDRYMGIRFDESYGSCYTFILDLSSGVLSESPEMPNNCMYSSASRTSNGGVSQGRIVFSYWGKPQSFANFGVGYATISTNSEYISNGWGNDSGALPSCGAYKNFIWWRCEDEYDPTRYDSRLIVNGVIVLSYNGTSSGYVNPSNVIEEGEYYYFTLNNTTVYKVRTDGGAFLSKAGTNVLYEVMYALGINYPYVGDPSTRRIQKNLLDPFNQIVNGTLSLLQATLEDGVNTLSSVPVDTSITRLYYNAFGDRLYTGSTPSKETLVDIVYIPLL